MASQAKIPPSRVDPSAEVSMVGQDTECPPIQSLGELLTKQELADKLGLKPATVSIMRFREPRLPYIRFGAHLFFSETQVVWFLNKYQREVPDPYYIDRMRRVRIGLPIGRGRRPSKADV